MVYPLVHICSGYESFVIELVCSALQMFKNTEVNVSSHDGFSGDTQ